jgi:hypothetical protein
MWGANPLTAIDAVTSRFESKTGAAIMLTS